MYVRVQNKGAKSFTAVRSVWVQVEGEDKKVQKQVTYGSWPQSHANIPDHILDGIPEGELDSLTTSFRLKREEWRIKELINDSVSLLDNLRNMSQIVLDAHPDKIWRTEMMIELERALSILTADENEYVEQSKPAGRKPPRSP